MVGRRAFARGSSVWARAFNQQLPRRMAGCFVSSKTFTSACFAESPLHGFAEQHRVSDLSGLVFGETSSEVSDELIDNSVTIAEIINSVVSLNTLGILRNYTMLSATITQHY